jgi:hypothetical protein
MQRTAEIHKHPVVLGCTIIHLDTEPPSVTCLHRSLFALVCLQPTNDTKMKENLRKRAASIWEDGVSKHKQTQNLCLLLACASL